jgi:hypothetical protein
MTKDEALRLALEALEANQPVNYCLNGNGERFSMMKEDPFKFEHNAKAITAIKATLEAPQRTWVGPTDDDKVLIKHDANFNQFMTAGEYADKVQQLTEARLKDLNT